MRVATAPRTTPTHVGDLVGAELPTMRSSWNGDDVILYHLGLGAGVPATAPEQLAYVLESRLAVLPTFGTQPVLPMVQRFCDLHRSLLDPRAVLHVEHELVVHRQLPVEAEVESTGRVVAVEDKRIGAVLVVETITRRCDRSPLCTNRFLLLSRDQGGFGGGSTSRRRRAVPARPPDLVVDAPTMPQQALLFRLSGDRNPLHVDPDVARVAGFDRPILHGLCSYGMVCKLVVDHVLGGDASRVRSFEARFADVVFPGEVLVASMWFEGDHVVVSATTDRGTRVLTHAAIGLHEGAVPS